MGRIRQFVNSINLNFTLPAYTQKISSKTRLGYIAKKPKSLRTALVFISSICLLLSLSLPVQAQLNGSTAVVAMDFGYLISSPTIPSGKTANADLSCDNVTSGGHISGDESNCGSYNPSHISSTSLPSGGSGTIEYIWLRSTATNPPAPGDASWQTIAGATSHTYDPGTITQTTHYIRCARRHGCTAYDGESNVITKTVTTCSGGDPINLSFDCGEDKTVDVYGKGLVDGISQVNIPNAANVERIVVETIIKPSVSGCGSTPSSVTLTAGSNTQNISGSVLYRNGNPTGNRVYRTEFIGSYSSVSVSNTNGCNPVSLIVYAVRNQANGTASIVTADYDIYRTTETINVPIGTSTSSRNITLRIPVSELTNDSRIIQIGAVAGSASNSITENTYDPALGNSLRIIALPVNNVPGNVSSITLTITSPDSNGDSFMVGAVSVSNDQCTSCDNVTNGGTIGTDEQSCEPYDPANIVNVNAPSGGTGTIQYRWQRSTSSQSGPWTNINGANNASYNPGYLNQTNWFRRLARRDNGCTEFTGISNVVVKVVDPSCSCEIFCPGNLTLDCDDSTHPDNTGYAIVLCGDGSNNQCERAAGNYTLSNENFNDNNTSYSLDQGWNIGSGCNPNCGDGSTVNAYIDFTQFNYAYNRSITSPSIDACCIDEVEIDYCLRQDLFTNGAAPVQYLYVEASINGGAWNAFKSYTTVNGQTLDYLETNITVPGAANNNFRVRFRVQGPGGNFSLGGWGLDNVRLSGSSSGCDTDAPNNYTVTYSDNTTNGSCAANKTITRTWRAERFSGEILTCTQQIQVVDDVAPDVVSGPADLTVECNAIPGVTAPTFSDACDNNVSVSFQEDIVNGSCTDSYVIRRTWTATDDCNNQRVYQQEITVEDTTNPSINDPADLNISCENPTPNVVIPSATDNCDDNVNVVLDSETSTQVNNGSCQEYTYTITRVFRATDNCGNVDLATQLINVSDQTDPIITSPATTEIVECNGSGNINQLNAWLAANGNATAADNCATISWTNNFNALSDLCGATGTVNVVFTAADACGNTASTTGTFTIQDQTPPVAVCQNITVQLDANGEAVITPQDIDNGSSDVCGNIANRSLDITNFDRTDLGANVVTLTVTDACGNPANCTATVTVEEFDLALRKTLAAGEDDRVYTGENITFTIEVFNQGTLTASNIEITDYIPTGLTLNDGNWSGSGNTASRIISGPIAPGASATVNITFTVNQATDGPIINRSEIKSADAPAGFNSIDVDSKPDMNPGNDVEFNNEINNVAGDEDDADLEQIGVKVFDLALRKTLADNADERVYPGEFISFKIEVLNQGTAIAQNIEVSEYIPEGLVLADENWTTGPNNTATRMIPGPIFPGQTSETFVLMQVSQTFQGEILNRAEISRAEDELGDTPQDIDSNSDQNPTNDVEVNDEINNGGNDEDDADVERIKVEVFDIALRKTLNDGEDERVYPGEDITFKIEVINQGTVTAQNIDVIDYIPAGLTLNDPNWSAAPGNVSTRRMISGPIAPGESVFITITFTVTQTTQGQIINIAEIESAEDEFNDKPVDIDSTPNMGPTNDSGGVVNSPDDNNVDGNGKAGEDEDDADPEDIQVEVFDLALRKTLNAGEDARVYPGEFISFKIEIFNQGTVAAENVTITEYIPAGMSLEDSFWTAGP
ncbi:MAG: hypothetical protein AB8G15_18950, partial [Saprospiraceae bacterium]